MSSNHHETAQDGRFSTLNSVPQSHTGSALLFPQSGPCSTTSPCAHCNTDTRSKVDRFRHPDTWSKTGMDWPWPGGADEIPEGAICVMVHCRACLPVHLTTAQPTPKPSRTMLKPRVSNEGAAGVQSNAGTERKRRSKLATRQNMLVIPSPTNAVTNTFLASHRSAVKLLWI